MKIVITFLTITATIYAATTPKTSINRSEFTSSPHGMELELKKSNRSGRIVGGEDAYEGEFPFIVSLKLSTYFLCPVLIFDGRHKSYLMVSRPRKRIFWETFVVMERFQLREVKGDYLKWVTGNITQVSLSPNLLFQVYFSSLNFLTYLKRWWAEGDSQSSSPSHSWHRKLKPTCILLYFWI